MVKGKLPPWLMKGKGGKKDPAEPDQDDKPMKKGAKKEYDPAEPDSDDAKKKKAAAKKTPMKKKGKK